jgi:hypothetical protein
MLMNRLLFARQAWRAMFSRVRSYSTILQLTLISLLCSALSLSAQPVIDSELNLGGPVLSWQPDPLAQGYSIQYSDAPELQWQRIAVMADNNYYPSLQSGFFRVTPLYSSFLSFTDTLRLQIKTTCNGWEGPQGQNVLDLHEYSLDLFDASFADTLRFYPDAAGWTLIPIRDDDCLQADYEEPSSAFGTVSERDRFSFKLNVDKDAIVDLFGVPEDLPLTIRPSIWFLFQAGSDDWEYIVSSHQLDAGLQDGYLRFPQSWYERTPIDDNGIGVIVCDNTTSNTTTVDTTNWQTAAVDPEQPLPEDIPSNSTWLTRGYDGIVIAQQRLIWSADLLLATLVVVEVEQHFEYNTQQYNNRCHDRLDRIRGPPHTS